MIKGTGIYKSRDGRKVFIVKKYGDWCEGVFEDDNKVMNWDMITGQVNESIMSNDDIVDEWKEDEHEMSWEELCKKVVKLGCAITKFTINDDTIDMHNKDLTCIFGKNNGVYILSESTHGFCKIIKHCNYNTMSHLIDCLLKVDWEV